MNVFAFVFAADAPPLFMTIGSAMAVFTAVILALTVVILIARDRLVPQGEVTIEVNGDPSKSMKVSPGDTLLTTLSSQKVFIPSACGGGGTCAMCVCQVDDGGGDILPTETGHISMRQQKDHWRLACQVKVKQNMKIRLPEEVFGVQKFEGTVISNDNVATFIKEFKVALPEGVHLDFEPGGYVQIDVPRYNLDYQTLRDNIQPEYHEDWDKFNVWAGKAKCDEDDFYRAYSMANYPAEGDIVMLNIRIASPPPRRPELPGGVCSSYIFSLKPGDKVTMSGPYGEFAINNTEREMVYIGGGAGMAPLRSQMYHLFRTENTKRKISYWYGARSMKEVFYLDELEAMERDNENFSLNLALSDAKPEDNWDGYTGFIHQVLFDNFLKDHESPEDLEYYICGPPMMNAAVLKMLDDLGVPTEMIRFDDFG